MFLAPQSKGKGSKSQATTPDLDDSISFTDDGDVDVDVDVDAVPPAPKPHFLDYDAVPPPDFVENFERTLNIGSPSGPPIQTSVSGEKLKMDKKFERDGEISDYELAASGYTKKEFTQDDNTLHQTSLSDGRAGVKPRKHFLDENPIPPDYMLLEHELREHRSLDRNFERHNEQSAHALTCSPSSLTGIRKSSLDRNSRDRFKDTPPPRLPKGAAWTQSFDSRYPKEASLTGPEGELDTLGPKVECVYSLLSMLGSNDPLEMAKKFHELSRNPDTCLTLRRSGCISLLVQMTHAEGGADDARKWAAMALHNVVHSHPDEKAGRREAKVLRLLDQIMDYCGFLRTLLQSGGEAIADDADRHPLAAMSSLMKVSFDEEHRHAMCELGALQAIPSLVHLDHAVHGPKPAEQCCNSLRRYALMALTNLTFGDENNKALLCSQKLFMEALVAQLDAAPDDLLQVTASVLRNLSWRADSQMKAVLNEIGTVTALARAAMQNKCENTLKAILSALWNLSAHCSTNKAEFCAVEGALSFIVQMLTYEGPSKTLKIIENAGGILRNVSSHIAVREDYRQILREHNCLAILLQQLKSESLTVVSNSCGTLWNLSARCPEDQRFLWDNGAVPMLRSLIHSKHAMISEGSACALKNLLNFRPSAQHHSQLDPIARSLGLKKLPTLTARKQKALEQELGVAAKIHAETCENLDNSTPKGRALYDASATVTPSTCGHRRYPVTAFSFVAAPSPTSLRLTRSAMLTKSESRDSVLSAKSDTAVYEHLMRSHSAGDASRKQPHMPHSGAFVLERDVEPTEEQPIDYSVKYNEHVTKSVDDDEDDVSRNAVGVALDESTYQETDLDQPTDFSLRYAENQTESDADLLPETAGADPPVCTNVTGATPSTTKTKQKGLGFASGGGGGGGGGSSAGAGAGSAGVAGDENEIILVLEDSVKCYQTEDTPYVISNAASVTDLRTSGKGGDNVLLEKVKSEDDRPLVAEAATLPAPPKKYMRHHHTVQQAQAAVAYGSGSYTPEKPINYCEEGTPGYFSRYESLSSLDESPPLSSQPFSSKQTEERPANNNNRSGKEASKSPKLNAEKSRGHVDAGTQSNSALETPLMFSRHSSMDSLAEEDVGPLDDKSSVVSEFSRLASGAISPSEIPDSPTQSMPQSPRRNSGSALPGGSSPLVQRGGGNNPVGDMAAMPTTATATATAATATATTKRTLRSVFEDDLSTFHVENTPAQFSTATSLSNLSILDEEPSQQQPQQQQQQQQQLSSVVTLQSHAIVEGEEDEEEEEDDAGTNNDDLLLASCINIGMNRNALPTFSRGELSASAANTADSQRGAVSDEPKQYFTEDTPALLSKVASNTNLSAISICSSNNELKDNTVYEVVRRTTSQQAEGNEAQSTRHSLNLSDDMSSNASESGAAGNNLDILQQCIRAGMQKSAANVARSRGKPLNATLPHPKADPIAMLRRGGNVLPPYLSVNDELNKYRVEDSPCSFSVVSGLSNLTVGSSLVGPAVTLHSSGFGERRKEAALATSQPEPQLQPPTQQPQEDARREQQWQDDSLSSLSIDSEDETNLLNQAIAAGCNRPRSNLGFSTTPAAKGPKPSLSASQPIPIHTATSASSLLSSAVPRSHERRQKHDDKDSYAAPAANESYSSVESSDSNDNQSKSLFELCILTGMHKTRYSNLHMGDGSSDSRTHRHSRSQWLSGHLKTGSGDTVTATTQSNPNLKQIDALPLQQKQLAPNRYLRERERRDEKLLLECINTGIMKKVGAASEERAAEKQSARGPLFAMKVQPKNGRATSAAARDPYHITATPVSLTSVNITAAPDVEKNDATTTTTTTITTITATTNSNSNINTNTHTNSISISENTSTTTSHSKNSSSDSPGDITDVRRNPAIQAEDGGHRNLATAHKVTNAIGCKPKLDEEEEEQEEQEEVLCDSISAENTINSDESNQSFIMETTVSLDTLQRESPVQVPAVVDKHKDPDLMLKSVERLTLEFVSSAEQLRTNGAARTNSRSTESSDPQHQHQHQQCKRSTGEASDHFEAIHSNSNNTWNEDTCPNDVSFPSVSVTAPVVASLSYDDNDEEDEEDEATTADYKELNDFAENTPTNEELPAHNACSAFAEDLFAKALDHSARYDSLETETEATLINDNLVMASAENETTGRHDNEAGASASTSASASASAIGGSSIGINFKLGGKVQSAAAVPPLGMGGQHMLFGSPSALSSAMIANEAGMLATNFQPFEAVAYNDYNNDDEMTFSMGSLDLDNIRPPSGMESLNISGYYQEVSVNGSGAQPDSLQRTCAPPSLQLSGNNTNTNTNTSTSTSTKSPKFPRKSISAGFMARRALGQLPVQLTGSSESVNSSCNVLLENIKPPSLMDELLDSMMSVSSIQSEIADCESLATTVSVSDYRTAGGDDDSTVTLQSGHGNISRDEETTVSSETGTPLPSDYEFSSAESTPRNLGVKRTLTPKQKRKLIKDRFKTYTIAADMVLSEEQQLRLRMAEAQQDESLAIEILDTGIRLASEVEAGIEPEAETKTEGEAKAEAEAEAQAETTARDRRRSSQDRYRTQTIVYAEAPATTTELPECPNITDDYTPEDMSSNNKVITEQYKQNTGRGTAEGAMSGNCGHTPNANSLEFDQNSETESCHEHTRQPTNDAEQADVESNSDNVVLKTNAGPRIARPLDVALEAKQTPEGGERSPKAIRGRKRPAYVSPYSMQYQRTNSAPPPSAPAPVPVPVPVTGPPPAVATTSVINPTRLFRNKSNVPTITTTATTTAKTATTTTTTTTNIFRRRNGNIKTAASVSKMAQKKKINDVPSEPKSAPPVLERQGTFVKDEPSVAAVSVPVVESSPTKQRASKLPTKRQASATAPAPVTTSPQRTAGTRKLPTSSGRTIVSSGTAPQRSNSNANIRVTSAAARIAVLSTRISSTTPPTRSNSSLNSSTAATQGAPSGASKINQAKSRIAGIWKRVDEAKMKQQQLQKSDGAKGQKQQNAKSLERTPSLEMSTKTASTARIVTANRQITVRK